MIVDALTREYGRLALVARGARGGRSAWHGLTEPFRPLRASFSRRGEMGALTGLESDGPAAGLAGEALWCGFYLNELLVRLLPRDEPVPELLDRYAETLTALPESDGRGSRLRRFELALLAEQGLAPDLATEAESGAPLYPDGLYALDSQEGPRRAADDHPGAWPGRAFLALATGDIPDRECARQTREIMRRLLSFHLGDRPLYTPELMRSGYRK